MKKKLKGIFVSIIAVLSFIPFINVKAVTYDPTLDEVVNISVFEDGTINWTKSMYAYGVWIQNASSLEYFTALINEVSPDKPSINLISLIDAKCPNSSYGCANSKEDTYKVLIQENSPIAGVSNRNSEFTLTYEGNKLTGINVKPIKYTVTFDSNGGTTVSSQKILKDSLVKAPKNPTKNGFVFAGWYKDEDLTNKFNFNTLITKNITLYAKWYRNISGGKVSGIVNKTYNGYYQKQNNIIVKVDGIKLYQGTDYKTTYKSNLNTGKATVTITGIGEYRGTITKTFKIIPSKPVVSITSRTKNSLSFKWKKISTSTGYQIAFRQMGPNKYKYYNITTISKKFTGLKSQRYHQMKVRAYKIIDGKKVYGSWSNVKKVRTK